MPPSAVPRGFFAAGVSRPLDGILFSLPACSSSSAGPKRNREEMAEGLLDAPVAESVVKPVLAYWADKIRDAGWRAPWPAY
jgi:hypothetical protein